MKEELIISIEDDEAIVLFIYSKNCRTIIIRRGYRIADSSLLKLLSGEKEEYQGEVLIKVNKKSLKKVIKDLKAMGKIGYSHFYKEKADEQLRRENLNCKDNEQEKNNNVVFQEKNNNVVFDDFFWEEPLISINNREGVIVLFYDENYRNITLQRGYRIIDSPFQKLMMGEIEEYQGEVIIEVNHKLLKKVIEEIKTNGIVF